MEKPETIRSYLDAVALQIRWKRARPVVLHELENHLEDQRAAFEQENAADAERRAVEGVAAILKSAVGTARWFGTGSWETAGYSLGFDQIVPGFGDNAFPAALLYHLGWFPFLVAVFAAAGLTLWLVFRGLRLRTQLGRAVTLAVGITLCAQAVCSLAWNLGFPLFEVSFPLLVGNTATILNLFLIGLALSELRTKCIARDVFCTGAPTTHDTA